MNFLAHYYLLNNKEDEDIVLGNLILDLNRGFTKIYHQQIKNNSLLISNKIVKGIEFHLKTDLMFHQHTFFIKKNEIVKNNIFKLNLPSKKYYLTSHILIELLIDQSLRTIKKMIIQNFSLALRVLLKMNTPLLCPQQKT